MLLAQQVVVQDQATNQPLELVKIAAKHTNGWFLIYTDANGKADISQLKETDSIYFSLYGYNTAKFTYIQLQKNDFNIDLAPSSFSLDEVVISANRWQQDKKDVPNKITTIRRSDVVLQNPQTAADMLSASGEVYVQKSQLGGGSPMIRGFSTNRVLLTVDGVRMNNAIFRSGNLQNVIALDAFATERTEVIFGPGSVIYGSDAIGGIMSFYTLMPKFSSAGSKTFFNGSAVTRYSSANNERTDHLDFNIGFKKISFLTSVSYSQFDDLKMGKNGPDEYLRKEYASRIGDRDTVLLNPDPLVQINSGYSQINLMQKIRFKPNEKWDFNYGLHYSTSSDVPRYDRLIEYRKGKLRDGEWYYGPQKWLMNNLNITYNANNKVFDRMNITLAHQQFGESRHNRSFNSFVLAHRTEDVNALSANIDFEKTLNEKNLFFYGAEIVNNVIGSIGEDENIKTGTVKPADTRYPDGSTWKSYAAYLSHQWKPTGKTTVQSGLRYSHVVMNADFDTTFFPFPFTNANIRTGSLNGSVGLAQKLFHGWQINTNISTGFRAPNIDDIGKVFESEPGAVVVPNPNLSSEYAYNAELGIEKIFGELVKMNVTGFYTILDNALVRRNFTLNGLDGLEYDGEMSRVQAVQNAAKANVYGIQAGLDVKFPLGFGLTSRFNYQKGTEELEDKTIAPLRHAAPWFGTSHITYSGKIVKADLYAVYNGEVSNEDLAPSEQSKTSLYAKDKDGKPYSPGWYTLNIKASFKLTNHFMLNAGIENITDIRYRPYSAGITAPGRNFIVSARATF
ncbi:MAG: TonB-dependent receptor [Bacteroidia bacterium]